MLVERTLVIELKSVDEIKGIHEAQLLTYMKLAGLRSGLLINFNVRTLKERDQTFCSLNFFVLFVSFVVTAYPRPPSNGLARAINRPAGYALNPPMFLDGEWATFGVIEPGRNVCDATRRKSSDRCGGSRRDHHEDTKSTKNGIR